MKKGLGVIFVILLLVLGAGSVLATDLSGELDSQKIILNDGSMITKNDARSLSVDNNFQ